MVDRERDLLEHFDGDFAHLIGLSDLIEVEEDIGMGGADHGRDCG
jgi:hypothetical protein